MEISQHAFVSVEEQAEKLGCQVPAHVAVLPRNFATADSLEDLVHESNCATVRKLLAEAGVEESRIEPEGTKLPEIQENDFTWLGPTIFFAAAALANNPDLVTVALGVVSNYVSELFRGVTGQRRVRCDVVVEQTKTKKCVRIHFEGDPESLSNLQPAVMEAIHDDRTSGS